MLTVSQLSFERYFQPVFRPLSFTLDGGGLLLITGANGCGKTTLIRLLAGILTATAGKIQLGTSNIAYIGHRLAIKDDLSVVENVRFVRNFLGAHRCSVDEVVRQLGLLRVADQLARTLSAGQRKRCALARLLLCQTDLWLLDEPYSNLDDEGIALVDKLLMDHCDQGGHCVLATHGHHRPSVAGSREIELLSGASDS